MKRCAAVLERNQETGKEEWRFYHNPTIGDIRRLRQRGAIVMRQLVERYGNEVHKRWVTDSGVVVVHRTDYLSYEQLRRLNDGY
jgi:hypothetical protein